MRILLVEGRFYEGLAEELADGAIAELKKAGFEYDRMFVPGAFEIPATINFANQSSMYDGYVALGCVIRGETTHYDYVCSESARGLMDLALQKNLAIGYGILTVENEKQAWVRASRKGENRGATAARACIKMIHVKNKFSQKNEMKIEAKTKNKIKTETKNNKKNRVYN